MAAICVKFIKLKKIKITDTRVTYFNFILNVLVYSFSHVRVPYNNFHMLVGLQMLCTNSRNK